MEFHQLRYFVAVAEAASFSRAAEHCHVAQPSLSQQIRKLEREFGHTLFTRSARGAQLTDAGQALLPRARRILGEVNAARACVRADLDEGAGRLAVGAIPTMAPYVLPPLIQRFTKRYPRCELTVREDLTERLLEALLNYDLDLAVTSTPIEHDALHAEVVGHERMLLALNADFKALAGSARLALGDLRDQPAVVLHEMHCLGQQIESFCAARRVTRRIICRSTQLATVLRLVAAGLGISLVPEMCAGGAAPSGCMFRGLGRGAPTREIAVVRRSNRPPGRLGRELVGMLRADLERGRHAFKM